jgi:hypothetical protein
VADRCWSCLGAEYHDYSEDPEGILRCPRCGELEKDDPKKVVPTSPAKKAAAKTTPRSK